MVGSVPVGGDAPISVQSMTNTPTSDAAATLEQIRQLEEAGADIVRVSCPDEASTAAFRTIARESRVPLVADIHFHYKRGIEAAEAGADYVAFGAFYPTATKAVEHVAELDTLQKWSFVTEVPCVAIGGITSDNAKPLIDAGADFIAVSSAVWNHPQGPAEAVRAFNALLA